MDKETDQQIMDKIGMIVWFMHTEEYKSFYGDNIPLWIFWTPKGDKRRDELLHLIEEKVNSMYMPEKAEWFCVGSGELSTTMLSDRIWYKPTERKVISLLPPASRA